MISVKTFYKTQRRVRGIVHASTMRGYANGRAAISRVSALEVRILYPAPLVFN